MRSSDGFSQGVELRRRKRKDASKATLAQCPVVGDNHLNRNPQRIYRPFGTTSPILLAHPAHGGTSTAPGTRECSLRFAAPSICRTQPRCVW
jgi:hypothetical protein